LKAHNDEITKLQWLENKNILITGGKDKKLRVSNENKEIMGLVLPNS
jgi:WD domain, G-beta repeat.